MNTWIDRLATVECPAFTARRARRGERAGAPEDPIVWAKAQDEFVWDTDGKRYLDMTAGFGVMSLGHSHPQVRAAVENQLGRLWHALGDVHPSDKKVELMERLCALSPFSDARAILGLSGSDAVDAALKTAQMVSKKPGVIAFEGGYHGLASGPLAANGYRPTMREPFSGSLNPHVTFLPYATNEEELAALKKRLEELDTRNIGALLVEPIQGRGGIVVPDPGLLAELRAFCSEREIVLICDEVLTGFGRTGALWASEDAGAQADLLCVGKALGGGLPVSACIGPYAHMKLWGEPTSEALHTGTFFGNPLSAAAALGFLEAWHAVDAVTLANERGAELRNTLDQELRGSVRGRGMMLALELGEPALGLRLAQRLRQRGVLVLPNGSNASGIQLTPPLNLPSESIEAFARALRDAVHDLSEAPQFVRSAYNTTSTSNDRDSERNTLCQRIRALITKLADGSEDQEARDALIDDVCAWQQEHVPALAAWQSIMEGDALPTEAFRTARIASFSPAEEIGYFLTSGTTEVARGTHFHRDLSLYDLAAKTAAKFAFFPDCEKQDLLIIAPRHEEAPHSSLFYMLSRFADWFGAQAEWFVREGEIDVPALAAALSRAEKRERPVALLGTSLAFWRLEHALKRSFCLPAGSRLLHTGGFKGQSIEVGADELRTTLAQRYGLREAFVVREYGMTEMSSQLYEWSLRDALAGRPVRHEYWVPGWVRAQTVSPASLLGAQVSDESTILRFDDLANLDTCVALQTFDVGSVSGSTLSLRGRIESAPKRGCSLTADQWRTKESTTEQVLSGATQ